MGSISRKFVYFGYSLVLAILVANGVLTYLNVRAIIESDRAVFRSREFLGNLSVAMNLLVDSETGQRGYLLTGDHEYLVPYRNAVAELNPSLDRLKSLADASSTQPGRIVELKRLANDKLAELKRTVDLMETGNFANAQEIVRTGLGRRLMVEARELGSKIAAEEDLRLGRLTEKSITAARRTVASFVAGTSLTLLLLLSVIQIKRREDAESRRAAEVLRQSEAWFRTTLEGIGDAVIATDSEGRIRLLNPISEALTGWTLADAQGLHITEIFQIVNETTRAPVENPIERVIEEGLIVGLANHTVLIARDGTETPIEDSAAPIKDDRGQIVGVVMVFRDVRDRRSQEKLEVEQKKLAEFGRDIGLVLTESKSTREMLDRCAELTVRHLDGTFARIWTVDETDQVLELRSSAGLYTHIDGPHARVPIGSFKIGLIAKERRPHLTNSVVGDPLVPAQEWASREGIVAFAGFPLIVEDRVVGVWAMFARKPLSEATLRAMGSVANGIALGIEQKRNAEVIARNEVWLSTTLRSIGDAVIATDEVGRVRFMNPVAEQLTGWPGCEATGRPMEEVFRIIDEETRQAAEHPVTKVIREGVVVGLANHTLLVARDGTETPIEDSAAPIKDEEGQIVGVVLVFHNASEKRRHERERERLLAIEREARAEAQEANRAKDQFLSVLSHELRTPLNPILLAVSSMLERTPPAEEVLPTLEMIRQNVNLQARLIDDLLDVMRIVQGKLPLHWGVCDAHDLIHRAVDICRSDLYSKGIRLEMSLKAEHHHVNADSARLQQVYWNLIKNAVKFTPHGGSLAINSRNEGDTNNGRTERLIVEFRDNGIGIEPEAMTRIFDPFQQAETSITRRFGGLGLGLAIGRGIVEAHGGLLSARSAGKDQGTTFRIELRTLAAPAFEEIDPTPVRENGHSPERPEPQSILLVEDEPATIRLMARLLRSLGHEVTTAATIKEALDIAASHDFSLVISDIGLPDGSGLELMRNVSAKGPVKAIALTGYGMEEDIRRSREAGFSVHMTKPIDFSKLEAMIRQILT